MIQYTNKELCKRCGGRCCKSSGCLYAPEDFEEISFNSLMELYEKNKVMFMHVGPWVGIWKITWVLATPKVNGKRVIYDMIEEPQGNCVFLTEKGCALEYHHRPRGGKNLIPLEKDGKICCKALYNLEKAADDWEIYNELIAVVIDHIEAIEQQNKKVNLFNHELCTLCGGGCCKASGCYFSPKDFKRISYDLLKRILYKGYISLVLIHKEATGLEKDSYTLRMRNKDGVIVVHDFSEDNEGPCIALEETGCPFNDDDRPYGGKSLVPNWDIRTPCQPGYSIRQCAEDWLPYQDVLNKLAKEFAEKDIEYEGI